MSIKTNFKQIALVAVAALGLGLLSSVPAKADIVGIPTVTPTNGTAQLAKSDSTTAATLLVKFNSTGTATDSVAVTVTLGKQPTGSSIDSTGVFVGLKDTSTSTGGTHFYGLRSNVDTAAIHGTNDKKLSVSGVQAKQTLVPSAAGQVAGTFRYYLDTATTRVEGTYTFDYSVQVFSQGVAVTTSASFGQFTIVVSDGTAAATGAVSAAGTSTAVLKGGSTWAASGDSSNTDSTLSLVNTPTGTAVAVIRVTQKNFCR